ncbi:LexA family protein [Flavobacterium sp.]|uniref:LexA family protein n=1 Tax=Flavobacterium sp. TaxID=239 RepID=UPI003BED4C09
MSSYKEQYLHVPPYILNDFRLDSTKKILLSYILSFSKTEKGFHAKNYTIGELLGINDDGASKQVSQLKKLGYIDRKIFYKNYKSIRKIKVLKQSNIEQSNNFFINIPYSVLFDNKLSSTQKLLLSEILALIKLEQGCIKSNREFGELLGIGTSAIFKQIKKLVEMDYIIINDDFKQRKIELTSSYITNRFVPKSQNGYSKITKCFVPESQNGYSCGGNIITTVTNSVDILHELTQYTSTENKIDLTEIEQKILNSCERGEKLMEQAKKNCIDNYWHFGNSNQEVEYLKQIVNEYLDAKTIINKPLNEDESGTNGIDEV